MAGCTGSPSGTQLEPELIERLAVDVFKCVRKDHLVKAKFILKGLSKDEKRRILSKTFEGNTALFLAAQQGQVHFVNYLVEECSADIEQRGVYEVQEDRSRHQVTPLWCAAVANKLEVVKALVKHKAYVNATSDTESTPVRSACYMTNIDVVKYLIDNGADIHKPNINGGTCLINSVQSVELCRFLITKGANVNAQDNTGNLALHYAIREGRLETVKLLLHHKSDPYVVNDFGDDAIQTASIRGYKDILDYLIQKIKPPKERRIEAYELMATNFIDEKHDLQLAMQIWREAMEMRFQDANNILPKPKGLKSNSAYKYVMEATSLKELEEIASNPDLAYMQALLIRERILGTNHKDTIFGLMYRGAVYADTHMYQRCVDLWKYAFTLRHEKREALNHECLFTLQALCKLFWEIYEEHMGGFTHENVLYDDVFDVFKMAVCEVQLAQEAVKQSLSVPNQLAISQQEELHTMLLLTLHLIHLLCCLEKSDEQAFSFHCLVHRLIRLHTTGTNGKTLLHLAVDKNNSMVSEEQYSSLPSVKLIMVLLNCGIDVNTPDGDGKLSLHVCLRQLKTASLSVAEKEMKELGRVTSILIDSGSHVDACDKDRQTITQDISNVYFTLRLFDHVTLKCLASRVIRKHRIPYHGQVPQSLVSFIEMH